MSMKKFLTFLLALSMILSSFSTVAFAVEVDLSDETEMIEAAEEAMKAEADAALDPTAIGTGETDETVNDEIDEIDEIDETVIAELEEEYESLGVAEYEGTVYEDAVKLLSVLGIMEGKEDGDFAPMDTLTRAEMSTLATRFLGMQSFSAGITSADYTDVAEDFWGKPFVDMATAMKLVNGNGDGTFNPEGEVTAEEAIKIIVCALGYEAKAADRGGWPAGYLRVATELELMKGLSFPDGYSTAMPRWKVAVLLYNALEAELMEKIVYGKDGFFAVNEASTALDVYHRVAKGEGVVDATYTTALDGQVLDPEDVIIDGVSYTTKLNMESATGYKVKFYYTIDDKPVKNEIVAYFLITEDEDQTIVDFDDVISVDVSSSFDISINYYQNGKREKKLLAKNPKIMYNSKNETFADAEELAEFLEDNTNQGRYVYVKNKSNNVLFIENYDAYVVSMIDDVRKRIFYNVYTNGLVDSAILDLSDEDAINRKYFIYGEDGNEIQLTDLVANDVIMVYVSRDTNLYKIYQVRKSVTGIINQRDAVRRFAPVEEEENNEPTPTPKPTPYWVDPIEVNMDGFERTSVKPGTSGAESGFAATKTQDGRTINLIAEAYAPSSQGHWGIGKWTGFMATSGSWGMTDAKNVNAYYNDANRPAILGETVFDLNRGDVKWGSDNANSATAAGFEDVFFGDKLNAGDTVKITAWVYAYSIRKSLADRTQVDDQVNADVNFRMWLSDYSGKYNVNGTEENLTINVPAKANQWTEITLEATLSKEETAAHRLMIDNLVPDDQPMPVKMMLAGVRVERMVDPSFEEIPGRPEMPLDSTEYDIYIEDTKYVPVNSFPSSLLKLGQTATLFLDKYDKIVGYIESEVIANYGFLVNAGVKSGAFGDSLMLKIMATDGTVTVYETTNEVKAWDKETNEVKKRPAGELITNQPAASLDTDYVWSTNNEENFQCVKRTWTDNYPKNKSDAASRKIIYFETNKDGKIDTIMVPSMPEDHPDAKIKMIKDYGYTDGYKDTLLHVQWPQWLYHANQKKEMNENKYFLAGRSMPFFIMDSQDYDDKDCLIGASWAYSSGISRGRNWSYAQLYRYPGSDTVDFIVANTEEIATKIGWEKRTQYIIVDKILKTEEGFTLKGYELGSFLANHDVEYTFEEDSIRLFENIWATSPDADGERLTWDNIERHLGEIPYRVAYEAPVMGGQETPFASDENIHQGDVVRVSVNAYKGTKLELIEVVYRPDIGIPGAYSPVDAESVGSMYGESGLTYGEVVDINSNDGYFKIKGYYWKQPTDPISIALSATGTAAGGTVGDADYITEITTIFFPSTIIRWWDQEREQYNSAAFNDIEIGDHFFAFGNLAWPSDCSIFYKK